jgi:hypothetical protein
MNWRSPSGDDYNLPKYQQPSSKNSSRSFPAWLWLVVPLVASLVTNGYLLYFIMERGSHSLAESILSEITGKKWICEASQVHISCRLQLLEKPEQQAPN